MQRSSLREKLAEPLVWCPYTDKEIPLADTAPEHVVPLSLGGVNEFCVRTEKKANWDLGSKIDARLADEFRVKVRRNRLGMTGHSGKYPVVKWKHSELDSGEPVQVTLDRGGRSNLVAPPEAVHRRGKRCANPVDVDHECGHVASLRGQGCAVGRVLRVRGSIQARRGA